MMACVKCGLPIVRIRVRMPDRSQQELYVTDYGGPLLNGQLLTSLCGEGVSELIPPTQFHAPALPE